MESYPMFLKCMGKQSEHTTGRHTGLSSDWDVSVWQEMFLQFIEGFASFFDSIISSKGSSKVEKVINKPWASDSEQRYAANIYVYPKEKNSHFIFYFLSHWKRTGGTLMKIKKRIDPRIEPYIYSIS